VPKTLQIFYFEKKGTWEHSQPCRTIKKKEKEKTSSAPLARTQTYSVVERELPRYHWTGRPTPDFFCGPARDRPNFFGPCFSFVKKKRKKNLGTYTATFCAVHAAPQI
jgi:hypothetical protein